MDFFIIIIISIWKTILNYNFKSVYLKSYPTLATSNKAIELLSVVGGGDAWALEA